MELKIPLTLPTQLKVPKDDIWDYHYLFAAGKKVGKTSFATQAPQHYMNEYEVGNAQHLIANYNDITSWEVHCESINLLEANPQYCKTFILDGIDTLYRYCYEYVRGKKVLNLEAKDPDNFDVWRTIKNLMYGTMERIRKLPCGKIYLVHTQINESTDIRGRKISKLETSMGNQQNEIMDQGYTHFWGVMNLNEKGERTIQLVGDSFVKAGNSLMEKHFRWKDRPIKEIPMGNSPIEAYNNFIAAFNNELPISEENLIKEIPKSQIVSSTPKLVLKA